MNLNTVLLSIVLALSGWTLTRVLALSEQMSALTERDLNRGRDILELRARLAVIETQLQANNLAIVRLSK